MTITTELTNTITQLLVFLLIPFVVYVIKHKRSKGFWDYVGLKKSNKKANLLAVLTSVLFVAPLLLLAFFSDEFRAIMLDPRSVTGKFHAMGFGIQSMFALLLLAVVKTALAEEILFRGFIAKRLIGFFGFRAGNIVQALLFGVIHTAIFAMATQNLLFLAIIFIVPAIGSYITVYLNEKLADGSIVPSWISHGLANVLSYSIVGFMF